MAGQCLCSSLRGLGVENDVILQQLDSISSGRRRETANFLDFANVANLLWLSGRCLGFTLLLFSTKPPDIFTGGLLWENELSLLYHGCSSYVETFELLWAVLPRALSPLVSMLLRLTVTATIKLANEAQKGARGELQVHLGQLRGQRDWHNSI